MNFSYRKTYDTFYDIKVNLIKQIIINEKLYSIEGLKYLIDIYLKKSEKHKFKEFALFAIIFATIAQEFIDNILFGNIDKLSKSVFSYEYVVTNIHMIITIVFVLFFLYIFYKFFAIEALNNKSNNYKILTNLVEDIFLSELICDLSGENNNQNYMDISSYRKQSCNKCRKHIPRININKDKKERMVKKLTPD